MNHTLRTVAFNSGLLPKVPETQYLLAGVAAVFTLEPLLVSVSFVVLKESMAHVEDSRTVVALHLCSSVRMQVVQMDT